MVLIFLLTAFLLLAASLLAVVLVSLTRGFFTGVFSTFLVVLDLAGVSVFFVSVFVSVFSSCFSSAFFFYSVAFSCLSLFADSTFLF